MPVHMYLVGGAVRDRLLGRTVRERDWVVTGATPQQLLALGYRHKDPTFPVFIHPSTGEEYALARRERKRGHGHKGFVLEYGPDVSLDEDLARRDLTINAMAQDEHGELHDPHGGYDDLAQRRLRHVTDAFSEDPLRVLRLARFAAELDAYGFDVAPETARLAARMSGDGSDLLALSPGRIWRETERALASTAPARFFRCLRDFGALPRLMPWLISARDPRADAAIDALERAVPVDSAVDIRLAALLAGAAHGGGAAGLPDPAWPLPRGARTLATLCIDHALPDPEADAVADWMEAMDAWRRGDRFVQALKVWRAVAPQCAYLDLLQAARDASAKVPAPAPGNDPRREVRDARRARLREALAHRRDPS
jgi:tRNA nucleotidyltransferase (CCA-adding enzyme)